MKRFRFPLESARRWRETQLTLEEAQYSRILARIEAVRRQIEDLEEAAAHERLALVSAVSLHGGELRQFEEFQRFVTGEVRRLRAEGDRLNQEAARQLERRNLADRNLQLLEKLKDARKEDWRIEQGRELQDLADEAFSARLAHKLTDANRPK